MVDSLDFQRVVLAVIAGAIVMVVSVVGYLFLSTHAEAKLHEDMVKHKDRMQKLEKEMDQVIVGGAQFDSLSDLMKPYKKHLLQSAFDLQSRLTNQLQTNFLNDFATRRTGARDKDYAIGSTTYFFAEFLAWLEVIRRQVVFVTGSEYAESLNSLLDCIRFQLTGESPIQGCPPPPVKAKLKTNDDLFDINSHIMQLYIVDIRSIGNAMLHMVDNLVQPIPVDTFLMHMHEESFKLIMEPLTKSIRELAALDSKSAPKRRLAILQVLLCKLIGILDSNVPWDCGPKFDSNEEPRYIMRDPRLTPRVMDLSNAQKSYLQSLPFFDDDPNLSFPGFREDLNNKLQSERDLMLWPGACPPQEPRLRDEAYKKMWLHTQAVAARVAGKIGAAVDVQTLVTQHDQEKRRRRSIAKMDSGADPLRATLLPGGMESTSGEVQVVSGAGGKRGVKFEFVDGESLGMGVVPRASPSQAALGPACADVTVTEPKNAPWGQRSVDLVSHLGNVLRVELAADRPSKMLVTVCGTPATVGMTVNDIARALKRAVVRWKLRDDALLNASAILPSAGGGKGSTGVPGSGASDGGNLGGQGGNSVSVSLSTSTKFRETVIGKLPGQALLSLLHETRMKRLAAASSLTAASSMNGSGSPKVSQGPEGGLHAVGEGMGRAASTPAPATRHSPALGTSANPSPSKSKRAGLPPSFSAAALIAAANAMRREEEREREEQLQQKLEQTLEESEAILQGSPASSPLLKRSGNGTAAQPGGSRLSLNGTGSAGLDARLAVVNGSSSPIAGPGLVRLSAAGNDRSSPVAGPGLGRLSAAGNAASGTPTRHGTEAATTGRMSASGSNTNGADIMPVPGSSALSGSALMRLPPAAASPFASASGIAAVASPPRAGLYNRQASMLPRPAAGMAGPRPGTSAMQTRVAGVRRNSAGCIAGEASTSADATSPGGGAGGPWVRLNFEVEHPTGSVWTRADMGLLQTIPGITDLRIQADQPSVILCTVCDSAAAARSAGNTIARLLPRAPVNWSVDTSGPSIDPVLSGNGGGAGYKVVVGQGASGNFRATQNLLPGMINSLSGQSLQLL